MITTQWSDVNWKGREAMEEERCVVGLVGLIVWWEGSGVVISRYEVIR